MKLSVIVPVFIRDEAGLKYLEDLLKSIPDQEGVEVLLINDSSPFNVKIEANFLKTVVHMHDSPRRSAGAARNFGLKKALGSWLVFADADDVFEKSNLEAFLARKCHEADVLFFKPEGFSDSGKSMRALSYQALLDLAKEDPRFLSRFHVPWSKIIRREFVLSHGLMFSETMVSNDVLFNLDLFLTSPRVLISDDVLYHVREHDSSLTTQKSLSTIKTRINIIEEYNRKLRKNEMGDFQIERIKQLRHLPMSPFFIFKNLVKSVWLGEPVFLTYASRKIIQKRNSGELK